MRRWPRPSARSPSISGRKAPVAAPPGTGITVSVDAPPMQRLKGPDLAYVFPSSEPTLASGRGASHDARRPETPHLRRVSGDGALARDLSEQGKAGLPPNDALAVALEQLPDRLTFLAVSDQRESMLPDVLVALPGMVPHFRLTRRTGGLACPSSWYRAVRSRPCCRASGAGADVPSSIAIDPDLIPEPDALRPFLFPSVTVLSVDDQGIRFISRRHSRRSTRYRWWCLWPSPNCCRPTTRSWSSTMEVMACLRTRSEPRGKPL